VAGGTTSLRALNLSEFSFDLPPELIAQEPPALRGGSRLLVMHRAGGTLDDRTFAELPALLRPGDLLVLNDTRVFPARLLGRRLPGGGAAECLLVRRVEPSTDGRTEVWEALVHPGQRLKSGSRLEFGSGDRALEGQVLERRFHGRRTVRLTAAAGRVEDLVDAIGHVPLPPYIKRADSPADRERYQTVYARDRGSIAAPTAGLHFTPEILTALDARGVERTAVTLHVGYGTFEPIRVDRVEEHRVQPEHYEVSIETARALTRALAEQRRIIAVGTTTTRTLESLEITAAGEVQPVSGSTDLFIYPGFRFRLISGLVTNFHLPRSSLLVLVSAFAGRERVLAAYRHAVERRYRFYSYGDAMMII
jgi:S-adenosylmethionine:tRNA ribosyltransferase-isomerase